MGSQREEYFKKRKGQKKKRDEENQELAPYRYLIVCEGKKTEPYYFEGIKKRIELKYANKVTIEQKIELEIEGTGRNTNDLVNYVGFLVSRSTLPYGHIWVIFDKDDFTDDQFNSAIQQASSHGYQVGWSNEAIELWFLLHFEYLVTGIGREQYYEKLTEHFKKNKIANGKYEKNMKEIFDILEQYGSTRQAIDRGIKLQEMHKENCNSNSQAKMKPATTVHELVAQLITYFT
ncbi:MAG: RloB protein [Clostridia bacterium]|jgi:hypothetical protein|nr:RloB protein [Clostridia bacterium]